MTQIKTAMPLHPHPQLSGIPIKTSPIDLNTKPISLRRGKKIQSKNKKKIISITATSVA